LVRRKVDRSGRLAGQAGPPSFHSANWLCAASQSAYEGSIPFARSRRLPRRNRHILRVRAESGVLGEDGGRTPRVAAQGRGTWYNGGCWGMGHGRLLNGKGAVAPAPI